MRKPKAGDIWEYNAIEWEVRVIRRYMLLRPKNVNVSSEWLALNIESGEQVNIFCSPVLKIWSKLA